MTVQDIQRTETLLTTRNGIDFQVRPAIPSDEPALAEFFAHVEKDDLRFRFLSGVSTVGHHLLAMMTNVDHDRTENILAFDTDGKTIIASAMLAADEDGKRAEVAMAIREDFKQKGISWTLLQHLTHIAKAKGIQTLESIEARDHHEAIEMEREMGFKGFAMPGDATLIVLRAELSKQ
jgi:N-acetylglutamate synthase-like GNAT family acetyltransferase